MTLHIDRRKLVGGAAALGAGIAMPTILRAQSKTLVAATFPGTWNEADRNVIAPAFTAGTGGGRPRERRRPQRDTAAFQAAPRRVVRAVDRARPRSGRAAHRRERQQAAVRCG